MGGKPAERSIRIFSHIFVLLMVIGLACSMATTRRGFRVALAETSSVPWEEAWVTDGPVYAVQPAGDVTFIGGDFSYVRPNTGHGVPVDLAEEKPVEGFPRVNRDVFAVVADGSGGWFVAGDFKMVGDKARKNIARIASDGSVTPFNAVPDRPVYALALSPDGSVLFVGGGF